MATGMVRGFGPRALAGLGAAQQQDILKQIQGRDQARKQAQAEDSARAPEEATGQVLDARDARPAEDAAAQASPRKPEEPGT